MMTGQDVVVETSGWWDTIKMHIQNAWVKMQESQNLLLAIAIYGGIGFIVGYFLKKYAHFIVFSILLLVVLMLMHQFEYLTFIINWTKIQESLCMPAGVEMTAPSIATCVFEWTRAHLSEAISVVVGFLIGLRFG
jgi:uncharacterized membrane protein (Fun14 family)